MTAETGFEYIVVGSGAGGGTVAARLAEVRRDLVSLYADAFAAFARLLPEKGDVVILLPVQRSGTRRHFLDALEAIEEAGFTRRPLLPERYRHTPGFALSPRDGILYGRPGQFVERELLRFRKR